MPAHTEICRFAQTALKNDPRLGVDERPLLMELAVELLSMLDPARLAKVGASKYGLRADSPLVENAAQIALGWLKTVCPPVIFLDRSQGKELAITEGARMACAFAMWRVYDIPSFII